MGLAGGMALAGAAGGIGEGIVMQAEQKREEALLMLKRQWQQEDRAQDRAWQIEDRNYRASRSGGSGSSKAARDAAQREQENEQLRMLLGLGGEDSEESAAQSGFDDFTPKSSVLSYGETVDPEATATEDYDVVGLGGTPLSYGSTIEETAPEAVETADEDTGMTEYEKTKDALLKAIDVGAAPNVIKRLESRMKLLEPEKEKEKDPAKITASTSARIERQMKNGMTDEVDYQGVAVLTEEVLRLMDEEGMSENGAYAKALGGMEKEQIVDEGSSGFFGLGGRDPSTTEGDWLYTFNYGDEDDEAPAETPKKSEVIPPPQETPDVPAEPKAPAKTKAPDSGLPAPKTKAEYDALPSGARYLHPDGEVKTKA